MNIHVPSYNQPKRENITNIDETPWASLFDHIPFFFYSPLHPVSTSTTTKEEALS